MILDLACLAALLLAALAGALSGALRQLAKLVAAGVALVGARLLAGPAAEAVSQSVPRFVAKPLAAAAVFVVLLVSVGFLLGLLARAARATGLFPAPADRALGALLGGVKGAVVVWVLVSALVAWGRPLPLGPVKVQADASDFASFARERNALGMLRDRAPARDAEQRD